MSLCFLNKSYLLDISIFQKKIDKMIEFLFKIFCVNQFASVGATLLAPFNLGMLHPP
jgi:hypothetical protein